MNLSHYIKGLICITLTILMILFFPKTNVNAKENIDISMNELDAKVILDLIEEINEIYSKSNLSESDREKILNLRNIYDSLPEGNKSQIINIKDLDELIKKTEEKINSESEVTNNILFEDLEQENIEVGAVVKTSDEAISKILFLLCYICYIIISILIVRKVENK